MAIQSLLGLFLGPIVQILLAPKPPAPKPLALQDFDIPTADPNRELPWIFGSVTIDGPNVIWYGNLSTRARKKKSGLFGKRATVGYYYSMGLHLALAHEVDSIYRITAGDRVLWDGDASSNVQFAVDMPDLFGGTEGEGGMTGTLDFLFGASDQTLTGTPASLLGTAPAYRRVMSVLYDGEIGYNVRAPKALGFKVKRILSGWHGGTAWEPALAEVPLSDLPMAVLETVSVSWSTVNVGNPAYPPPGSVDSFTEANLHQTIVTIGPFSNPAELRVGNTAGIGNLNVDDYLVVNGVVINPDEDQTTPVPAGTVLIVVEAGSTAELRILNTDDSACGGSGNIAIFPQTGLSAMNPAHMVYQLLTTPAPRGMGYPTSIINEDQFADAAQALFDESLGLCLLWNGTAPIEDLLREVERHAGATLRQNMFNGGKFEFKLLRADYTVSALPLFDESNIVEGSFEFQRTGYGETVNEIVVTYADLDANEDPSITVQNLANIAAQGAVISETREYPGLPTAELAARIAERDLRISSTPLAKVRFQANRDGAQLLPGDVIRVSWDKLGLEQVVLRIVAIDYGQILNNRVSIEALEDVFGLPANSYVTPQPIGWVEQDTAPQPVAVVQTFELPLYSIALENGFAEAVSLGASTAYVGALAVAPQGTALQFDIYAGLDGEPLIDDGEGDFAPSGLLTAALAQAATSATLDNLMRLGEVEPGDLAVIGTGVAAEWIRILTINAGTGAITFDRGMLDTAPAAWPDNTRVWFADGSNEYASTVRATGDDVELQLLTITSGGTLPLASAPVLSVTPDQRLSRPYPPGGFAINGESYPTNITDTDVTLTWAHRDRVAQGLTLVTQAAASIGPEAGTSYTVEIYNEDAEVLLETESGITADTWTSAEIVGTFRVRVELFSVRDALESWQRQIRSFNWVNGVSPDPFFANVSLLLHANGADNSTTFTDNSSSPKTVTAVGNARIRTTVSKFGSGSIAFDGTGDALSIVSNADFGFGTGDFTLECFVYHTVLPASGQNRNLFDFRTTAGAQPFVPAYSRTAGGIYQLQMFTNFGTGVAWAIPTPTAATWYHVVYQRRSGVIEAYLDGIKLTVTSGNATTASGNFNTARPLTLGATPGAGADVLNGHLDEIRITKGVARYTTDFTPPTEPYPDS
ncbi:phage tail protein [Nevskia sp.]|uniref:phage tail protein n=1 Tax=Nevskia sp. TaxID=1929292 RepID=UPI0025E58CB5|nr:phage tail protein [Nevskia sp.]